MRSQPITFWPIVWLPNVFGSCFFLWDCLGDDLFQEEFFGHQVKEPFQMEEEESSKTVPYACFVAYGRKGISVSLKEWSCQS